nr:hypothetical protein [Roseobacter litoralis]
MIAEIKAATAHLTTKLRPPTHPFDCLAQAE